MLFTGQNPNLNPFYQCPILRFDLLLLLKQEEVQPMEGRKVELKLQVEKKGSPVINYVLKIALHVPLIMEKALHLRIYLLAISKFLNHIILKAFYNSMLMI